MTRKLSLFKKLRHPEGMRSGGLTQSNEKSISQNLKGFIVASESCLRQGSKSALCCSDREMDFLKTEFLFNNADASCV